MGKIMSVNNNSPSAFGINPAVARNDLALAPALDETGTLARFERYVFFHKKRKGRPEGGLRETWAARSTTKAAIPNSS